MNLRKLVSAALATTVACLSIGLPGGSAAPMQVSAATDHYLFDFGNGGTQSGYIGVSASDGFSSSKGYGFAETGNMKNVSASGSGALSDAVQFVTYGNNSTNTFNVNLDNGLYQVSVWLGNTTRTSVAAEGVLQLINLTGNNAYDTFQIPITDGQLSINCTAGKSGYAYTLSALEIKKISSDATMKPTIWICGDSTVCNYYPLASSAQAGWGQVLNEYVDTDAYEIRNLAASGQYAAGFVNGGQFDPILKYGKSGDIYVISIGINDGNYSNVDEYYQVVTSMTQQAKARGMTVILVKQQGRATDVTNNPNLTGRWYGSTLDKIGQEESVQVIDLFNLAFTYWKSIGQTATTALFCTDDTLHPNRAGAKVLAKLVSEQIDFATVVVEPKQGASIDTSKSYMFKNANSGMYMDVQDATAANGTNVQQWGAEASQTNNTWKLTAASDGYYYIYSTLGDSATYLLDLDYGNTENGTNIGIYENTSSDAQLFKFVDNGDGTYLITSKVTTDQSCIEVADALTTSGANVQQWEINGASCQKWYLVDASTLISAPVIVTNYGDVTCDGNIDIRDVAMLAKGAAGVTTLSAEARTNGDLNGDGNINVTDVAILAKYVAGIITSFPIQANLPPTVYYAPDAAYQSGATETTNAGFTGTSYVNLNNEAGSSIEFTVTVATAGNYLCSMNIANGGSTDRSMLITVNNGSDKWLQSFLTTSAWTTWNERGIVLPLVAGVNKIKYVSNTADGGPNMDYLKLEKTDEPIAETYDPSQIVEPPASNNPVVYIAGDSTVQSYRESYAPQQGWGYYLQDYFNSNVTVSNQSIAGRSSKSFYDNGRLTTILDSMKEGDYLLVQFGINDSASSKPERYAPVCGSVANATEGSFEYYIKMYVEGARAKGGTAILVTTVIGLKAYSNGKFVNSYGNYCQAMKDIAAYYNIPCVDLNTLMVNHYNSIGYDAAYYYHLISTELSDTDMTHFTETGAKAVAGLVANAIKSQGIALSSMVK